MKSATTLQTVLAYIVFLLNLRAYSHEHTSHNMNGPTATFSTKLPHVNHEKNSQHTMDNMMHGMYGNYPMTREASGTSWLPNSSPQEGFHIMRDKWMLMFNGFSYLVADNQRGPRGGKKIFNSNMFMFMAQRDIEDCGTIAFRAMFSLEPLTIGKCGYPLLFQTGETCDGITPLIDRQHPHDLFMELAMVNMYQLQKDTSAFLYLALPGEPALGPPIFIMRFASEYIPEAPLGHHWMDSTHVTFGVITAGFIHKDLKLEVSSFKGREPDENRFNIEMPYFDSYSFRISFNPTENWALQASYGFLKSPEEIHPEVDIHRSTYSAIYNKNFGYDTNLQLAAIVGINEEIPDNTLPAFLLDATLEIHRQHVLFSRFEWIRKDDLFIEPDVLAGRIVDIQKLTLGYIYEFVTTKHSKWGMGGLVDFPIVSNLLKARYGNDISYMFFLQFRIT